MEEYEVEIENLRKRINYNEYDKWIPPKSITVDYIEDYARELLIYLDNIENYSPEKQELILTEFIRGRRTEWGSLHAGYYDLSVGSIVRSLSQVYDRDTGTVLDIKDVRWISFYKKWLLVTVPERINIAKKVLDCIERSNISESLYNKLKNKAENNLINLDRHSMVMETALKRIGEYDL